MYIQYDAHWLHRRGRQNFCCKSQECIRQDWYISFKYFIDSVPDHNLLMIFGDFNARFGGDDVKNTMHPCTIRNGKLLADLILEKDLVVTNTYFQKRVGKLWTFTWWSQRAN